MKTYTCAICGKEHEDRDRYLACVTNCIAKEKIAESEAKKKRLEEVNVALSKVKAAKAYYEEQLAEFEEKYPEEYKMNFGARDTEKCDDDEQEVFTFSYEDNGKDKPVIKANGKDVTPETLFSDPDVKYLAQLLGILD